MVEASYERVAVSPEGHPGLGFSFDLPKNWRMVELPNEPEQFDKPTYFLPLLVCMAAYGAVVFSVGARPAYEVKGNDREPPLFFLVDMLAIHCKCGHLVRAVMGQLKVGYISDLACAEQN